MLDKMIDLCTMSLNTLWVICICLSVGVICKVILYFYVCINQDPIETVKVNDLLTYINANTVGTWTLLRHIPLRSMNSLNKFLILHFSGMYHIF